MLGNIGATELIVIFLIVLLVFGGKRIPEIAKGIGKGIKDFKTALSEPDKPEDNSKAPPSGENSGEPKPKA